jgi:hypothetical protein
MPSDFFVTPAKAGVHRERPSSVADAMDGFRLSPE